MNIRTTILCFVVAAFSHVGADAQTDFFWSFQDLHGGAANSAASGALRPGETGTLFLYYTTNGPADSDLDTGAFLDIATSQNDVIAFTHAESFDFEIVSGGMQIDNRWLGVSGGGGSAGPMDDTISADGQLIDDFHAFTVAGGQGIRESNNGSGPFIDDGYDFGADAFVFGKLDFLALDVGSVDIFTESGFPGGIVNDGEIVPATFGDATIIVSVPEPTTAGLLAVCVLAMSVIRRRRRT